MPHSTGSGTVSIKRLDLGFEHIILRTLEVISEDLKFFTGWKESKTQEYRRKLWSQRRLIMSTKQYQLHTSESYYLIEQVRETSSRLGSIRLNGRTHDRRYRLPLSPSICISVNLTRHKSGVKSNAWLAGRLIK